MYCLPHSRAQGSIIALTRVPHHVDPETAAGITAIDSGVHSSHARSAGPGEGPFPRPSWARGPPLCDASWAWAVVGPFSRTLPLSLLSHAIFDLCEYGKSVPLTYEWMDSLPKDTYEARERRAYAMSVLDSPEKLMMYAQSENDVRLNPARSPTCIHNRSSLSPRVFLLTYSQLPGDCNG